MRFHNRCVHRQADLQAIETRLHRWETRARRLAGAALSTMAWPPTRKEWIQFQSYHWVLDDQRSAFSRQLSVLRRYGDFISLDDAMIALQSPGGIGGRYFCLTFDDGFKHCFTNAVPILMQFKIPAAFFIPTRYIGLDLEHDWKDVAPFYERAWSRYRGAFEFLNWDDCRQLAAAGFTVGSHTHSHSRLTSLTAQGVEEELSVSKNMIETRLGCECRHFCCPWGKPNKDFDPAQHPELARRTGYASFLTTEEGVSLAGDSVYNIRRVSCEPELSPALLRYALFPPFRHYRFKPAPQRENCSD